MPTVDRDRALAAARQIGRFVPDVVRMLRGVLADDRVPAAAKVEAGAAVAYLLSPMDRLVDWVPVLGQLDDIAIVAFALRRLQNAAGEQVLREHWRGSDRSFDTLMSLTSAFASPAGMMRRVALVGGLAGALRGRRPRPGRGKVVDGEVVGRRTEGV